MSTATTTATVRVSDFALEAGAVLGTVDIAYETFGELNRDGSNAILIEHALTGDSHVTSAVSQPAVTESPRSFAPGWWEDVVGPGRAIDTNEFFVVCANALGGCTGTTGPTSLAPDGLAYGGRFPRVSIRDMVRLEGRLADYLNIDRWHAVIGGSMGGARALEWALVHPDRVANTTVLAAPAFSTADQIAWAHTQIQAIQLDPDYCDGDYLTYGRFPKAGLGIARQIAHLTYRAAPELNDRFERRLQHAHDDQYYAIQSYLDHQATKLVRRFDAQSYVTLTQALREHDVRRGRADNLADALSGARSRFQVISMSSDRLYTPAQVKELAQALPGEVAYAEVTTWAGHDGFLTEAPAVGSLVKGFIEA